MLLFAILFRSYASGFIFTTALPPAVAAGAIASIQHLKVSSIERERQKERVAKVRARLDQLGIPHMPNPSHIVPVMVGDPVKCKMISDMLMDDFSIYVQPINYPTVPRGTERLRLTPSPMHSDADIDHLMHAFRNDFRCLRTQTPGGLRMTPLPPLCLTG